MAVLQLAPKVLVIATPMLPLVLVAMAMEEVAEMVASLVVVVRRSESVIVE